MCRKDIVVVVLKGRLYLARLMRLWMEMTMVMGRIGNGTLVERGCTPCRKRHTSMLCVGTSLIVGVGAVEQVRHACSISLASTWASYTG